MMQKRTVLMFIAFCVLASADWLLPVSGAGALAQQAMIFAVIGLIGLVAGRNWKVEKLWQIVAAGVVLLGVPAILIQQASQHVSDVTVATVFALVPAIVALAIMQTQASGGLFAPAILGFSGLLFVLPVGIPGSTDGRLWLGGLVLAVVMTGLGGLKVFQLLQGVSPAQTFTLLCLPNAALLLLVASLTGQAHWSGLLSVSTAVHAVTMILLVVLFRDMAPVRLAGRYLLIPLLTVVEGYVLIHPQPTWRMGFGFVLAAVGTGGVLLARGTDEGSLSLR
jgi:drug/metabolite transporter (DMT)-like permease